MKRIVKVIAIGLTVAGLSVFGAFANGTGENGNGNVKEEILTVMNFGTTYDMPEIVQSEIDSFEQAMKAAGTPVKVDYSNMTGKDGDYATKLTLLFRSKSAPDVVGVEIGRSQSYMRAGYLKDITEYAENSPVWKNLYEPIQEITKFEDRIYTIPFQTASIPLYYRKDLFKKAGLNPDWHPTSWKEILDTAEVIKSKLPDVTPLLYIGGKEAGLQVMFSRFNLLLHGAGGTMKDPASGKWIIQSDALLDTLEFYEEMAARGLVDPEHAVSSSADEWAYRTFSEGKGAIFTYGPWAYNNYWAPGKAYAIEDQENVVGYVKMPAMEPGKSVRGQDYVSQSGGWSFAMSNNCKNPDLAWKFIEYMNDENRLAKHNTDKGSVATRKDVVENAYYQSNKFMATITSWLDYTYFTPGIYSGYMNSAAPIMEETLGYLLKGDWDAERAMKEYGEKMTNAVGAENVISK